MAIPITVPRLGWSMEEGTFVEWLKRDGDRIEPGTGLFVLESDKAAETIEAIDAGLLRLPAHAPQGGEPVKVGQVLAYLVAEGEAEPDLPGLTPVVGANEVASETRASKTRPETPAEEGLARRKTAVSPRARRVARELGVDWAQLRGSGRNGRVRERDVRAAADMTIPGTSVPHTRVRKLIAARMVAGVTQAAPVTLTTKADATNLVNLRDQFRAAGSADEVPSYTAFAVKLTATVLRRHPALQAQWREEGLFVPDRVHIAVAVDSPEGLLVPVIRDADTLSLRQVALRSRELLAHARAGRLTVEQMEGATFTITNLGMFHIDAFTPIIHLPQCAVLGLGRIVREPMVVGDAIVPRNVLTLSLTFDHRVIDGAPAARFLDDLRGCIEQPAAWLVP